MTSPLSLYLVHGLVGSRVCPSLSVSGGGTRVIHAPKTPGPLAIAIEYSSIRVVFFILLKKKKKERNPPFYIWGPKYSLEYSNTHWQ